MKNFAATNQASVSLSDSTDDGGDVVSHTDHGTAQAIQRMQGGDPLGAQYSIDAQLRALVIACVCLERNGARGKAFSTVRKTQVAMRHNQRRIVTSMLTGCRMFTHGVRIVAHRFQLPFNVDPEPGHVLYCTWAASTDCGGLVWRDPECLVDSDSEMTTLWLIPVEPPTRYCI